MDDRKPDGYWVDMSREEFIKILKDILETEVPFKIKRLTDLKNRYGSLYTKIREKTGLSPAELCRQLGYPQIIKSDKRKDLASLQERLGNTTLKITETEIKMAQGHPRTFIKYVCDDGYQSGWMPFSDIVSRKIEGKQLRCPRCNGRETLTNEVHDRRLKCYYGDAVERLENVVNATAEIVHRCKKHNREWKSQPQVIAPPIGSSRTNNKGCPECSGREPLTNEELDKRLQFHHNGNIERMEDATNNDARMRFRCIKHESAYEWETEPYNVAPPITATRTSHGCPKCSKRTKPTNEEHDARLKFWHGGKIIRIKEVETASTPILHKCLIHNYEWNVTPNKVAPPMDAPDGNATGCPYCKRVRSAMGMDVQCILHSILKVIFGDQVLSEATEEVKQKSCADGMRRGIMPDFMAGNQIIECKLSMGAVFQKGKCGRSSQEKYSPYAKVIHIVFEPWKYMKKRFLKRGDCLVMHVSLLLKKIKDDEIREGIVNEIASVLERDERNVGLGLVEEFIEMCKL